MAKLLASLLISGLAFIVCAVTFIVVTNSLFGWECTRTSIQMMYSIVTLAEMDIGQLQVLFAVAGLLSVLASVSFTLFLSSKCKSTVSSLAASLVFCIAPVVICMTVPGALSTWLCSILPRQWNKYPSKYSLCHYRFPVFECWQFGCLDTPCHDWGLHY